MNIILVSSDPDLRQLCVDILGAFEDPWHLSTATAKSCLRDADFYIWDSPASTEIPEKLDRPAKHLFLVNRNEIATLYHELGSAEANILLKPVTRASLAAFLSMAGSSFQDRL